MSVIAEFTIDADEFLLGEVLGRDPVAHVEMERVVPTSRRLMPYVWVHGVDRDEFEATIAATDHVKEIVDLDHLNGSSLYRISWEDEAEGLIDGIAETDATILEARGKDEWFFRIRFPSHPDLAAFHSFCSDHGTDVTLDRVYSVDVERPGDGVDLTETQRETLFQAVRDGYFEVPRRTNLSELGEKLGVSEQSVSENLRRGADTVLKQVVFDPTTFDNAE